MELFVFALAVQLFGVARFGFVYILVFLVGYTFVWTCSVSVAPDRGKPDKGSLNVVEGPESFRILFAALFLIGPIRLLWSRKAGPDDVLLVVLIAAVPFAPLFLFLLPSASFSLDKEPLCTFIGFLTVLVLSPATQYLLNRRRALPLSPAGGIR
jgi:hypothetical protein